MSISITQIAYELRGTVPLGRENQIKELAKAIIHQQLPLSEAHKQYRKIAKRFDKRLQSLNQRDFVQFLCTLSLFLKTGRGLASAAGLWSEFEELDEVVEEIRERRQHQQVKG
jgi:3-methyladenine DNA glycosylase/8-oxoguanine DNA glycosylase